MLRRITPIITVISFIIFSFYFAISAHAASLEDIKGDNSMDKYLQDFCKKRQGNQMNLETWYSGKCTDDTFSGDGVGFSDIVILDLAEKLSGKKDSNQTFLQIIQNAAATLQEISLNATPEEKQLSINAARQEIFNQQGGMVTDIGNIVGLLFKSQPASTNSYLAHINNNLQKHKLIPNTYAASNGIGFSTFSAFLPLWTAMRNISYLGLVIFFIVYGFMMMFRVNLGQKTVISIQLAIPKLVVTLIIITFSYAIVGLMIDLMWIMVYFSLNFLNQQGIIINFGAWYPAKVISGQNGIFWSLLFNSLVSVPSAIYGTLSLVIGGTGIASSLATLALFFGPGKGITLIIGIIISIAVIISYGKLFFKLISALISIIISLVTAPLVLLGNAFPGSNVIGSWFRGLLANISVFPITMILLVFSYILMVQPALSLCGGACDTLFGVKNLTSDSSSLYMPLISPVTKNFDASGILALLGVGLLLMASKYVDIVKDTLKVPPFKYGSAIGDALKQGWKTSGNVPSIGTAGWYRDISNVANLPKGTPIGKEPAKDNTLKP